MKKIVLAAALSLTATSAFAAGPTQPVVEPEPQMEPVVVEEDTAGSAQGIIVPLIAVILLAAAVSD